MRQVPMKFTFLALLLICSVSCLAQSNHPFGGPAASQPAPAKVAKLELVALSAAYTARTTGSRSFAGQSVNVGSPVFQISPAPGDFGPAGQLEDVFKDFTVTNVGTGPFTITGFTFASGVDFSFNLGGIPGTPGIVQPGQSSPVFRICFHIGLNFGHLTDTFTITDDTTTSPHVFQLTGFGFRTAPDFNMSTPDGSPALATITAGQTASFNLLVASLPGFGTGGGSINLSCSGAPTAASCSPNPSFFALPDNNPGVFVVTVGTTSAAAPTVAGNYRSLWWSVLALPAIVLTRRRRSPLLVVLGILLCGGVMVSCGGGSGSGTTQKSVTPPGTYSMTVTASSGSISHAFPMTLVVK